MADDTKQELKPLGEDLFVGQWQVGDNPFAGYTIFQGEKPAYYFSARQAWALLAAMLNDVEPLAEATGNAANPADLPNNLRCALLYQQARKALALQKEIPLELMRTGYIEVSEQILKRGLDAAMQLATEIAAWRNTLAEVENSLEEGLIIHLDNEA